MKTRIFPFRTAIPAVVLAVVSSLSGKLAAAEPARLPGKFVWADLVTDQPAAARAFYSGLFGWKFRGAGDYRVASNRGQPVAGMIHKARPAGKPQASPRWFGYLSVDDVARAERLVKEAGGRVTMPAGDLRGRGRQAVFADPEGALFGVLHTTAGDPPDAEAGLGDWVWIQLLSRDARDAASFYRELGGYYDDPDIIVLPPGNRPDAPVRPSQPIARPPMGGGGGMGGGGFGGGGMGGGGRGGGGRR